MCRMCSYYTKIDLKQLPTSNPFLDDMTPTPIEGDLEVPNDIIVESPESRRYTAWTNLRRFPSLHRSGPNSERPLVTSPSSSSPNSSARSISIYGPREMSKDSRGSYITSNTQSLKRKPVAIHLPDSTSFHHKLQHHNRTNYFPRLMTAGSVSSTSSQSSTPRNMSPVSDDEEFDYLPSPARIAEALPPLITSTIQPTNYTVRTDVAVPEPLRFSKHQDGANVQWMQEAYSNL